jgi:hypothetical protein
MSTEFDELKAGHARELAELELKLAIQKALPDLGIPWRVHVSELYGTVASASIEYDFFGTRRDQAQPTLETVTAAGMALPGVPLVLVRDGCLSFRPLPHVEAVPEEKKERWKEELQVCPFVVRLSAFQRHTAEFDWVARLSLENHGESLVRVRIRIPTPPELGRLNVSYSDYMGGRRVKDCRLSIGEAAHVIYRDGNSLAGLESPIRWASGSAETPNDFTLYWVAYGDELVNVSDLVETVIKKGIAQ